MRASDLQNPGVKKSHGCGDSTYKRWRPKGPSDPAYLRFTWTFTRVFSFVEAWRGRYGYESSGVKLGDAGKILFWYRPSSAAEYRVLYGDLRVGSATADQLPRKP
jgi:hypothetical protein